MDDDLDAVLDQIDAIEEDLDDRRAKIAALERLAGRAPVGSERWAEPLLAASDHHTALLEHDVAIAQLEQVRAAGTPTEPSIEAHLLAAHLSAGNDDQVAELDRDLRIRSREVDLGDDYSWIGESYEEAGRLQEALRWFSMANRDVDPDDVDLLETSALTGRWRVRRALGLPPDAYDDAAEIVRAEQRARWAAENST